MQQTSAFSLTGLGKRFGYRKVLERITLKVGQGEFLLVLGNNGAGKSTLLRVLSSLMRPSEGSLLFFGKTFGEWGPKARSRLGMISHDPQVYGALTALENLKLWAVLYGVESARAAITSAVEQVGLEHTGGIPVRAYSSGMLKRLAIARLLLHKPEVLLLDEPYAGLDQDSIALFDQYLAGFQAGGGTVVLVTHQFSQGIELSNRVVILHQGVLRYNKPAQGLTAETCARLLHLHGGSRSSGEGGL